jgi:hypothetical protein
MDHMEINPYLTKIFESVLQNTTMQRSPSLLISWMFTNLGPCPTYKDLAKIS